MAVYLNPMVLGIILESKRLHMELNERQLG